MKKINKITNITLIFILTAVFLGQNLAYSASGFCLRPNLAFGPDRKSDTADRFDALASNQTAVTFDYLLSENKQAVYQVFSDDKELGDIKEGGVRWSSASEKDSFFTPAPLVGLRERNFMWDFIRNPSTDLVRIAKRQDLLAALKDSGLLEQITKLKNASYLINQGVEGLFEQVSINDYHRESALFAYRHGHKEEAGGHVMDSLSNIKQGKEALASLIKTLRAIKTPIIEAVIKSLEQGLASVEHLNDNYFLKEEYDEAESISLSNALDGRLMRMGSIIEFANIIVKDEYSRAAFDSDKTVEYSQGWNFVREKKGEDPQVLNDSAKDNLITILCGPNMGGKSFNLAQNFYIQLLAQSFGFVPAKKGNFRVYDSFLYLDRASTESDNDLSAYGAEIRHWVEALGKMKKKVFMLVDEGFSTTSAEDQYCLLMGTAEYLKRHGGRTILATHNEAFISNYSRDSEIGIYNFPFTIKNKKKGAEIQYSYKLTEGIGDARALEVAESLGLPKELIELATQYLKGIIERVDAPADRKYRSIARYAEKKREALKKEKKPSEIFGKVEKEKSKNKVFQLFSKDTDFETHWFTGSSIETGEDYKSFSFGGWGYKDSSIRNSLIFTLLTQNARLDPREILERQKMFSELSQNDRYEEIKNIGYRLIWNMKFMSMYVMATGDGGFLDFNKAFKPGTERLGPNEEGMEYCIMFLRLNQKVLGKDFPEEFVRLLEKFEAGKELLGVCEEYRENQDISEIQKLLQDDYDEEILDEGIIKTWSMLAGDESDQEKWLGKLTRHRIKDYMIWLKKHDKKRWEGVEWSHNNNPMTKLIQEVMLGYRAISVMDRDTRRKDFNARAFRKAFIELADEEPLEAKLIWKDKICYRRLAEYMDYLKQKCGSFIKDESLRKKIKVLEGLISDIHYTQREMDIKDDKATAIFSSLFDIKSDYNGRLTDERIRYSLGDFLKSLKGVENKIPTKPIFECDLNSISGEIRFFARWYKKWYKDGDYEHDHGWLSSLVLAFILEMFVDERDYIKEFLGMLRSYDSVYLHQMANYLEDQFRDFTSIVKEDRWSFEIQKKSQIDLIREDIKEARSYFKGQREKFSSLCPKEELEAIEAELEKGSSQSLIALIERFNAMGPRAAFDILNAVYNANFKEMFADYNEVSRAFTQIFIRHPIIESHSSVEYVMKILDGSDTTDREKMLEVARSFEWLTHKERSTFNVFLSYDKVNSDPAKRQEEIERFSAFYQKEIVDSGLKKEIETVLAEMEDASKKAEVFIGKYHIVFKDYEGRDQTKDEIDRIRKANLRPLEREIFNRYRRAVYSAVHDYDLHDKAHAIDVSIWKIQALGLFGHMIKTQGFNPVKFNSDGSVNIRRMFSMFRPRSAQKLNDAHFGRDEYARLIAAPNMSGKTFYLKALTMAMLSALNTGFIPAEAGNMPLFDYIVYFDRVTSKLDRNLSAMGNEVEQWKRFFDILKGNMTVFVAAYVDEAFSTTSPKYQASLVYAVVMEMVRQGQYLAIASHNHDVLNVLRELEKDLVKAHTLRIHVNKQNGKVTFDYKLKQVKEGEMTFSEAIAVARSLGMPEEIIHTAEDVKSEYLESPHSFMPQVVHRNDL